MLFRRLSDEVADLFRPHPILGYTLAQKVAILFFAVLLLLGGAFLRYQFVKTTVREAIREERTGGK